MIIKTLSKNVKDLPKWAQSEIRILQMRLSEAKAELTRIKENTESNTIVGNPYVFQDEPIQYLRDNQSVSFILEKGYIQARIKDGHLSIHSSGEGDLTIRPVVSNSIQLHIK